jgi:hypothetical protein
MRGAVGVECPSELANKRACNCSLGEKVSEGHDSCSGVLMTCVLISPFQRQIIYIILEHLLMLEQFALK